MEEKTRAYTKSRLVKELAFRAGIKKVASRQILEVLVEIIKRETPNAPFVIPGLCKFELVPRKIRNPRTGASLIMPPQKALKVTPSRAVKMAVAPRIPAVPAEEYVPPSEPEQDVSAATPVVAPAPTPAPEPVPTPVSEPPKVEEAPKAEEPKPAEPTGPVSFKCPGCGQEIEAPAEAIGMEAECPMCGRVVVVPATSELGTMYGPQAGDSVDRSNEAVVSAKEAEEMDPTQLKNRTIRIDADALGLDEPSTPSEPVEQKMISFFCKRCHQEIEATADMAGSQAECPQCGLLFEVPFFSDAGSIHDEHKKAESSAAQLAAQKRATMRIDLSDDF